MSILSFGLHRIEFCTRGPDGTAERQCFAFTCRRGSGDNRTDGYQCHAFSCESLPAVSGGEVGGSGGEVEGNGGEVGGSVGTWMGVPSLVGGASSPPHLIPSLPDISSPHPPLIWVVGG